MSSISLRRTAGMTGLMAAALALLVAPQVHAQSITNAIQLKATVAPNTISGTKLGASVTASGNGLTGALVLPTIDAATGALGASSGAAVTGVDSFSFALSVRSADAVTAAAATDGALPGQEFGYQTGTYSATSGGGVLAISAAGAGSITNPTTVGLTTNASVSTSLSNGIVSTTAQRSASASNDQTSFTSERQGTSVALSGTGMSAATVVIPVISAAGASEQSAVGTAGNVTTLPTTGIFTVNNSQTVGQASAAVTASSTSVTQPVYGIQSNTLGGTTAGAISGIGGGGINTPLAITTGGAGTSSSLTTINSFSVFDK